jgi:integrase
MGLAQARAARDEIRNHGGARVTAPTLEAVTREWLSRQTPLWKPHHAADVLESLTREVWPVLGAKPIDEIDAPAILAVLRPVEARGAVELAHRLRQTPIRRVGLRHRLGRGQE